MIASGHEIRRNVKSLVRPLLIGTRFDPANIVSNLVWNRLAAQPDLQPLVAEMTDEQARDHFGPEEPLVSEQLRRVVRYFHAWRVSVLRQRIGSRLAEARILDVGDSDGLILKHLGKPGIGLNLSPDAIRNIARNGIEARQGDCHELPFAAHSFDYAFCFETLEHVESPYQVLMELARVCRPTGRVFVSVPWVPRTFIHGRQTDCPRGSMHIFEFSRDDFAAILSHTPLRISWSARCDVIGRPRTLEQWLLVLAYRRSYIIGGTFRSFQLFELALQQ